jgi:hypothetical protein
MPSIAPTYASCFATNVTSMASQQPTSLPSIVATLLSTSLQTSYFPKRATPGQTVDCSTKLDFNLFCKTWLSALTFLAIRHGSLVALGVLVVPARLFWERDRWMRSLQAGKAERMEGWM